MAEGECREGDRPHREWYLGPFIRHWDGGMSVEKKRDWLDFIRMYDPYANEAFEAYDRGEKTAQEVMVVVKAALAKGMGLS